LLSSLGPATRCGTAARRFGHPALAVRGRYQAQGIELLRSPDCGALRWRSGDGSCQCQCQCQCQRQQHLSYWYRTLRGDMPELTMEPAPESGVAN